MKRKLNFIKLDKTIISSKVKEAFTSVLPITIIVLILSFTITPLESGLFLMFIVGAFLITVGTGFFTLGADMAMTPIGEYVGSTVIKTRNVWFISLVCFIVGIFITIAEPDLQVLSSQLSNSISPSWILIVAVGIGVGVFLVVAFLRFILRIKLKYLLMFFYLAVFVLSYFVPPAFIPLAFDSGGVTTGPMSVPFIIAIGMGIASIKNDNSCDSDSFGLTALCSIGPILSVMILGIIFNTTEINVTNNDIIPVSNSKGLLFTYLNAFPLYLKEVAVALSPIVFFYFLFQLFGKKQSKNAIKRIVIGLLYTYFGLSLFLTGVNVGFLPTGAFIGKSIAGLEYKWIIIIIGFIFGYYIVSCEPAVHVLTKQVSEITSGVISRKTLRNSLMIGVAFSVAIAMAKILFSIPIMYILIPGYLIALILTIFVPDIFTAVAFDSGGVASGAMTASFILPLALGFCSALGKDVALQGFGVVALVAMTPLITIQILGLIFKIKSKKAYTKTNTSKESNEEIIE